MLIVHEGTPPWVTGSKEYVMCWFNKSGLLSSSLLLSSSFFFEEEAAVQSLKKEKSAGVDNIPAELVQTDGEDVITALTTSAIRSGRLDNGQHRGPSL